MIEISRKTCRYYVMFYLFRNPTEHKPMSVVLLQFYHCAVGACENYTINNNFFHSVYSSLAEILE